MSNVAFVKKTLAKHDHSHNKHFGICEHIYDNILSLMLIPFVTAQLENGIGHTICFHINVYSNYLFSHFLLVGSHLRYISVTVSLDLLSVGVILTNLL